MGPLSAGLKVFVVVSPRVCAGPAGPIGYQMLLHPPMMPTIVGSTAWLEAQRMPPTVNLTVAHNVGGVRHHTLPSVKQFVPLRHRQAAAEVVADAVAPTGINLQST
jgi:hypothetical protein